MNNRRIKDNKKLCNSCDEWLPFSRFCKNPCGSGGLENTCSICRSRKRRFEYYKKSTDGRPMPKNLSDKWCKRCRSYKHDINDFKSNTARTTICLDCTEKRDVYGVGWAYQLSKYNMTPDDYVKILRSQDYSCGGCKKHYAENGIRLCVDHDHSCCPGEVSCGYCVRGLLCTACNLSVGNANDDPEVLMNLSNYLLSHNP